MATSAVWERGREMEKSESVQEAIRLLGRVSVIKFKLLLDAVTSACLTSTNPMADTECRMTMAKFKDVSVFTSDAQFWACVTTLFYVYESAVKDCVPAADLGVYMQQLGMPTEHATKIEKAHHRLYAQTRMVVRERVPTIASPIHVTASSVDVNGMVTLDVRLGDEGSLQSLRMSTATLDNLIEALHTAEKEMNHY